MEPNELLGALHLRALDLGFDCVMTARGDGALGGSTMFCGYLGRSPEVVILVDGRLLYGPHGEDYVCALIKGLEQAKVPPRESFTNRRPAVVQAFLVDPKPPTRLVLQLGPSTAVSPRRETPLASTAFDAVLEVLRRLGLQLRAATTPTRSLARELGQLTVRLHGEVVGQIEDVEHPEVLLERYIQRELGWPTRPAPAPAPLSARGLFSGWGRGAESLEMTRERAEQLGLEAELAEVLTRLREHHRDAPSSAREGPQSDMAFLVRYLALAGDHMRWIAGLMVRGGLSIQGVARVFREVFELEEP